MKYATGKLPAVTPIKFKFAKYFDTKNLPKPPQVIGHELIGHDWRMLANDRHSNCVFAGGDHEHMIWSHMGTGAAGIDFTDANSLADYTAVTGFDPSRPETDQGTNMVAAAEYRRKVGLIDSKGIRHKIDCYFGLEPGDPDMLALAIYLTGAVGIGIRCPDDIDKLFDEKKPWAVTGARVHGGHYIPAMLRNSINQIGIITWGGLQGMEPSFYDKYCDEVIMYVSLEAFKKNGISPDGFAYDEVKRDLALIAA